jgi:glycosyltransferase involved in cell wall biosynthesis
MPTPEIALCLNTFQRPRHLRRLLASVAAQQGVEGRMEVAVSDDGSGDETPQIVEQFRRNAPFPVSFNTHERTVYHVSRCRNDSVRSTAAPYLLFVDGDCVLPPDHMAIHLAARQAGRVMLGDCYRIDEPLSNSLTEEGVARGEFLKWDIPGERRRLDRQHRKMRLYSFLRHPKRPKLVSNNVGVWRSDFERVNGFDENFRGWGAEDDDLGRRLRRAGVRIDSILGQTRIFHLWHPRDPTATTEWRDGANVPYLCRGGWLTRCRNGLHKRRVADLSIALAARPRDPERLWQLWRPLGIPAPAGLDPARTAASVKRPEVELLVLPGEGRFSGRAECNVLIVLDDEEVSPRLLKMAHRIVSDRRFPDIATMALLRGWHWETVADLRVPGSTRESQFPLAEFGKALESIT